MADDDWRIIGAAGSITITDAQGAVVLPQPDVGLPSGSRIRVDDGGEMQLRHDRSVLTIAGNSDVELKEHPDHGRITIIQRLGEIFLDVEPRRVQHLEVETPHLTAVVKGTEFTVAVAATGSTVLVEEGAVEVTSQITGQSTLVGPNQTARVAAESRGTALAQAGGDGLSGTAGTTGRTPIIPGGSRRDRSDGFSLDRMDIGDIGLTVGVALASILAILIAVSDAFAARLRALGRRVTGLNR